MATIVPVDASTCSFDIHRDLSIAELHNVSIMEPRRQSRIQPGSVRRRMELVREREPAGLFRSSEVLMRPVDAA